MKVVALAPVVLASLTVAYGMESKMSTEQLAEPNKRLIRKLYEEGLNRGNMDLVAQLISDDYVGSHGEKGPAGFLNPTGALLKGFPDIHYTLEDLVAEGDRVAVRWKWEGTHKGPFGGFPASGKRVTNDGIAIFQIKNNRVIQVWIQTDRLGFLQEMGAVPRNLGAGPQSK
jgi:steroid delta-isomerase-like uncharacterized protein